jgi:hypothetical protein
MATTIFASDMSGFSTVKSARADHTGKIFRPTDITDTGD